MTAAAVDVHSVCCPECGRRSWHPSDVEEDYCGACHTWNGGRDWLAVALGRRLSECGPLRQHTLLVCSSPCCGAVVFSRTVHTVTWGEIEQWWCEGCRRNGLATGRPKPVVGDVREFCGVGG